MKIAIRKKFFIIGSSIFYLGICLAAAVLLSISSVASAANIEENEVVFLLDGSYSMNETDAEKLAPDCFEAILQGLPSNYKIGFVVYGDDVRGVRALGDERTELGAMLRQVDYTGYTNAGAGLEKALSLFSQEQVGSKAVVFISDGEIMLEDPVATQKSEESFKRASEEAAKRGIPIYTIAIGDPGRVLQASIYESAKRQNTLFLIRDVGQLTGAGKELLYDKFGIAKISVSSGDFAGGVIRANLPLKRGDIDSVKLYLTSSAPMGQLGANYTAAVGEFVTGKRFAALSLRQPQSDVMEISTGSGIRNLQADLILEMKAVVKADIALSDAQMGARMANVRLTPISSSNPNVSILEDPYFSGKQVRVMVDGKEIKAQVADGSVQFSLPGDVAREVSVRVKYEDLGVNIIAPVVTRLQIEPREGYGKVTAMIAVVIAVAAVIWWSNRRKKAPVLPPPPASRYEYAGKLKLYVTKSPDGLDIAPMEYNLYRHFDREELSLAAILDKCGVSVSLPGAYKIFFVPGANKALILTNKSDCTILRNRDLLVKDHSCLVYFGERIHIAFEDEHSEMILEYKNVKPSERH